MRPTQADIPQCVTAVTVPPRQVECVLEWECRRSPLLLRISQEETSGAPAGLVVSAGSSSSARSALSGGERPPVEEFLLQVKRCQDSLVAHWREVSAPRRRRVPSPSWMPRFAEAFELLLSRWLESRDLKAVLQREPARDMCGDPGPNWLFYSIDAKTSFVTMGEPQEQGGSWVRAWHGTWWYALWLILQSGFLLESSDLAAGHEFWIAGVYCTPNPKTAAQYARPHQVFGDDMYHRVMLEVRYDNTRLLKSRRRGGGQRVLPYLAVAITGVLFRPNSPPERGEERIDTWDPTLEAMPPATSRPEPTRS